MPEKLYTYCPTDDEHVTMIAIEPETTAQSTALLRCPKCGRMAREYPNNDNASSERIIVWYAPRAAGDAD